MALRYYFDLVCPYSYILGFEVERAEDDGLAEVDWLPFELRPAPKELPEPRGAFLSAVGVRVVRRSVGASLTSRTTVMCQGWNPPPSTAFFWTPPPSTAFFCGAGVVVSAGCGGWFGLHLAPAAP